MATLAAVLASAAYAGTGVAAVTRGSPPQIPGHHAIPWDRSLAVDAHTVRLLYSYGALGAPADIATVSYRRRTVHITLHRKLPPGPPPTGPFATTLPYRVTCAEVKLARPLGRRRVVDGVTDRPPPPTPRGILSDFKLWRVPCAHPGVPQLPGRHTITWDRSLVVAPRTVRLLYNDRGLGPPADIATVSYLPGTVHITLHQKDLPGSPWRPTIRKARVVCAEVNLAHRLGGRRVVDGVTDRSPPPIPRGKPEAHANLARMPCTHPRVQ